MKKVFLFCAFLLCFSAIFSQNATSFFSREAFFLKKIPCDQFSGKKFVFEIAVRSDDTEPAQYIDLRVKETDTKKEHKLKTFSTESRKEQDWTIITVKGTIRKESTHLNVYTHVKGKGDFYFDDLNFYIEITKGKWIQVPVSNPSFEEKEDSIPGYVFNRSGNVDAQFRISKKVFKVGRQSLEVYLPIEYEFSFQQ